ncbi:MAG: PIN domain-containing protein [Armatimonadota bacterium]
MDKVFLDANILFSVAYRPYSRLMSLWSLKDTELVTSVFALEEARRNLAAYKPDALAYLDRLTCSLTVVNCLESSLPKYIGLADKDVPILAAALQERCSHLITGDHRHFGEYFGRSIEGVLILTPAEYLKKRCS